MSLQSEYRNLLMIPGPTPVAEGILDALSRPTIAHTSAALAEVIRHCQHGLCTVAGTRSSRPFLFAGSGTLAQEAALVNLLGAGDRLLVLSNGFFGDRFAAIATAHGIEVETVAAPWGQSVDPADVRAALSNGKFDAVTITHVETSTGTAAPVEELSALCREAGALVILDSVCGLAGMPVEMDAWGLDVVLSGAQKALGVPPGLSLLIASERAMERRRARDRIPAYYADLLNWEASMADPQVYFSTHAVNLVYALYAGLVLVRDEGLTARFARHDRLAAAFRAAMRALGFKPFTAEDALAPTLSVLRYPERLDDEAFRGALAAHEVVAAGCLGAFKGKGCRFGHMGNVGDDDIERAVRAAAAALTDLGLTADTPAALAELTKTP